MTDTIDPFQTPDGNVDYLAELVGEGKKFADVSALARGKKEADDFIETLKAELAAEREKAANGKSVQDILDALKQEKQIIPGEPPIGQIAGTPSFKEEDIAKIALTTLERTESERRVKNNYDTAVAKMQEVWGVDAGKNLSKVAGQLGVSTEYLANVAKQSPNAFFQLTGLNTPRVAPGQTVPTSSVAFGSEAPKRTMSYYNKLRRDNRALFNDTKTQIQMSRDAQAMGEAFFDN